MREWRKTHRLDSDQRRRANARSYASVYVRRGLLVKLPCENCGDNHVQMHHDDYDRPLDVRWLCRPCHLALHAAI